MIQVKRNQPTLFKEIERTTLEQFPLDTYEEQENDHGRQSHWFVNVYNARNSYKAEEWKSLSRFILSFFNSLKTNLSELSGFI